MLLLNINTKGLKISNRSKENATNYFVHREYWVYAINQCNHELGGLIGQL